MRLMPNTSRFRRAARITTALAVVAVLGACSDDGEAERTQADVPARAASGFPQPAPSLLETDGDKEGHVEVTTCDPLPGGGMRAKGTVENGTDSEAEYAITVYFVQGSGADQTAWNWATTQVIVPAGQSVPFVAERAFSLDGAEGLTCQVQAVR